MNGNDKVPQQINDIVGDNVRKLEKLFPEAVKDGEVDFDALKEALGDFKEVGSEKYEFTWSGKKNAKKIAQEDVVGRTLKFIPEDSKDVDTTENLYIEGDNLEVLKLIRQNYYGAIKLIYIDPPYNTGNDFVYNDNFVISKYESDIKEGNVDELGNNYCINKNSRNRYHTRWLNMMYSRLRISRELLQDDGLIFISIDINEQHNLKKICDEIFGEPNFIADFIWNSRKSVSNDAVVSLNHNYTLVYTKNITEFYMRKASFKLSDKGEGFKNPDNDPRGSWKADPFDSPGIRPNLTYKIINPNTGVEYLPAEGRCWRTSEKEYLKMLGEDRIVFGKNGTSKPQLKRFYSDAQTKGLTPKSLWDDCGTATDGTKEIIDILGKKIFDTAKPIEFINKIIELSTDKNSIVLDFFSGSATTAHATMLKNFEDGGRRKYIMVQIPECCLENSIAYKSGYKNICEIGKERIRRAGEKIKEEHPDTYIDIGFKVFRTADTNIKWNSLMDMGQIDIEQMETSPDTIDFMPGVKDIDIVYELMLRQKDVPLSSNVERMFGGGYSRTYLYADSYLVCLETKITTELINKLAEIDPLPVKFIFRDSAFQDNISLKDETFRRLKALIEKNNGMKKMTYTVEFL